MTEVVEELDTARGARRVRSRHAALGDDAMVTRAEEHWFEMEATARPAPAMRRAGLMNMTGKDFD
jgi:hypothetical protein